MGRERDFYEISVEILDFLRVHHNTRGTAVKSGQIVELFNIHKESLRRSVNYLRREGYPVCSSLEGYWYSERPEDVDLTLSHLEGRVSGINKAIKGLKQIRIRTEGTGDKKEGQV